MANLFELRFPFFSEFVFRRQSFPLGRLCGNPNILKTLCATLYELLVGLEKNPGIRFKHVPDEAKILQSERSSSELAGPGS